MEPNLRRLVELATKRYSLVLLSDSGCASILARWARGDFSFSRLQIDKRSARLELVQNWYLATGGKRIRVQIECFERASPRLWADNPQVLPASNPLRCHCFYSTAQSYCLHLHS